jgi:cyclopropane-fatty-acyl-phospholipid synthase
LERALDWVEQGGAPDFVIRRGIRALVRTRPSELQPGSPTEAAALSERFVALRDAAQVAPLPALANEQHSEVPQEFFGAVLGPHRKYSCCYYGEDVATLDAAEAAALASTMRRCHCGGGLSAAWPWPPRCADSRG